MSYMLLASQRKDFFYKIFLVILKIRFLKRIVFRLTKLWKNLEDIPFLLFYIVSQIWDSLLIQKENLKDIKENDGNSLF